MGKRAKLEGSIYQDKAGTWWAQLPAGPDGRRPRRKAATEKEALALLRQLHAERAAGRDLGRKAETVQELLDDWLETMRPHVRATTLVHYSAGCAHITERIGKMRAQDVSTEIVQRVANDLAGAGLGPATVRASLSRLRAAYERLIPERFLSNPVNWRKLKLRKSVRPDRRPYDAAQLHRLIVGADDLEARGALVRWAPAVWLAGLLGFRRGEVMGLTWRDVDFERSELRVRQQRAQGSPELFSDPKTPESTRTVPMGPRLRGRLREHWEAQQAERRHHGADWKEHGLVVCAEDGTPPSIDTLRDQLIALATAHRLPHVYPHLLRHTVATLLDELGYSETVIGAVLGHTGGKSVTRRYTHARAEAMRRAVEAVESAVFGAAAEAAKGVQ